MAATVVERLDRAEQTMGRLEAAVAELMASLIASGDCALTPEREAFLIEQGVEVQR